MEANMTQKTTISNQKPICFILANGLTNGGVTTWAINTSRRMVAKGQACAIISHEPEPGNDVFPSSDQDWIVECAGNASGHLPKPKEIAAFARCYASLGDAILLPNWSWGTWVGVAAMMRNPKPQNRVIGIAHTDEKAYYDIMTYYEPIISKFIAVSDQIYQRLVELLPQRQHDIIRLPYPVPRRAAEARSNEQRHTLRIGYAGRIQNYQKRILDLQDLVADLSQCSGHYCFEIAGDGTHLQQLKNFFNDNHFENVTVNFHGLLDSEAIASLWSSVDIGILFSSHEGLSISMIESMAAGCVQVLTNVSGVGDTVTPGVNGFVHAVGDTQAMASSLQNLWAQPELLSRLSTSCIEHVQLNHDPDDYDRQLMNLAQQARQQPQRRWPRFRRLVPATTIAEFKLRSKKKNPISLKGRFKMKLMALIKRLG
jgi:glycosyltransferase involved in cell wall biosynthesis